jgi:phage shock protein A
MDISEKIQKDISDIRQELKEMSKTLTYIEKDVEYHIKRTNLLERRLDALPSSVWAWIAGAVGLLSMIVSIIVNIYKAAGGAP